MLKNPKIIRKGLWTRAYMHACINSIQYEILVQSSLLVILDFSLISIFLYRNKYISMYKRILFSRFLLKIKNSNSSGSSFSHNLDNNYIVNHATLGFHLNLVSTSYIHKLFHRPLRFTIIFRLLRFIPLDKFYELTNYVYCVFTCIINMYS